MSEEKNDSVWFRYFPDHYQWSQLFCGVLNYASAGGSALWEVDQVGQRLKDRQGDNVAWFEEWVRMADYVLAYAEEEEKKGHTLTAARAYLRSGIYRFNGERNLPPTDPRKLEAFRKILAAFERGLPVVVPGSEKVDVPYEDSALAAYWIPPLGAGEGKIPAVVFFDGADVSKESTLFWCGMALRERGIGCLLVDGPGQGETLRLRNIPSRYDYEAAGTPAYDYIVTRPEVDPARVGVMAMSMGAYYAPRIAGFEPRYAGCVAWGSSYDQREKYLRRKQILESGGTVSSSPMWHLPYLMGCPDFDAALEKARDYNLKGVGERIRMPILIINGEDDAISPIRQARQLFAELASTDKELRALRTEEGGSQHCLFDNIPFASNSIADWWVDKLKK